MSSKGDAPSLSGCMRYPLTTVMTFDSQSPLPSITVLDIPFLRVPTMRYDLPLYIWAYQREVFQEIPRALTNYSTVLEVKKDAFSLMITPGGPKGWIISSSKNFKTVLLVESFVNFSIGQLVRCSTKMRMKRVPYLEVW